MSQFDSAGSSLGMATSFGEWLQARLAQERFELESRHIALCNAIRHELSGLTIVCQASVDAPMKDAAPNENIFAFPAPHLDEFVATVSDAQINSGSQTEQASPLKLKQHMASGPFSQGVRDIRSQIALERNKDKSCVIRTASKNPAASRTFLERLVEHPAFDMFFGALIIANTVVMAIEVEHSGVELQQSVGFMMENYTDPWANLHVPNLAFVFPVVEVMFGVAFTLEVLIKIVAQRLSFFMNKFNVFDAVIVLIWWIDLTVGLGLFANPMLLRLTRLLRLLRLLRLVRMIELFDTLLLMVSSIRASFSVLVWGTTVLVLTMTGCALILNNLLSDRMKSEEIHDELRRDLFQYWGTYGRCMVTMFEITLGNWVPSCRLLMDHISMWYGLAFIFYKCVVGFAVVKVITGVFMHETFKCAANDDELMIQRLARNKQNFKKKMTKLFEESDSSNDGMVELKEFKHVLSDERVYNWLQAMDITITNPDHFFRRIAGPDMLLNSDELIKNMARNRGFASQIDAITLLENCEDLKRSVAGLAQLVVQQGHNLQVLASSALDANLAAELDNFDRACVRYSPPEAFKAI